MPTSDEYLRPDQAAKLLNLSSKTLNRMADRGEISVVETTGGHRRYRRDEIERLATELQMNKQSDDDELLTPGVAAKQLSIDTHTLAAWRAAGAFTKVQTPGGHRRYLTSEVAALQKKLEDAYTTSQLAFLYQVSIVTVIDWIRQASLEPIMTPGGERRYSLGKLQQHYPLPSKNDD